MRILNKEKIFNAHSEHAAGKTIRELANSLDVLPTTLSDAFKRNNLEICRNYKPQPKFVVPSKAEISDLLKEGGKQHIAQKFGVSIPVVNRWLKELDIEIPKYFGMKHEIPSGFVEYVNEHSPSKIEICEKYKVSIPTVNRWLSENSIYFTGYTQKRIEPDEKILRDLNENKSTIEIAELFNVSPSLVNRWLRKYGMTSKRFSSGTSHAEQEILEFLNENGGNFVKRKSVLENNRLELDGFDKSRNIAFEYCGLYWHSSANGFTRKNHLEKFLQCEKKGIQLITIFENEWLLKREIVESILLTKTGKANRIHARQCQVKEIPSDRVREFHESNHIDGYSVSKVSYGLFFQNELVSVMSFGKPRYDKTFEWELIRFSTKLGSVIVGGASKIFSYFCQQQNPKNVLSYANLRFGTGKVYQHLGFELVSRTPPNYFYFKNRSLELHSRMKFQKHKLEKKLETFDLSKTEADNMFDNGYYQIWDCGHNKWIWSKEKPE